MLSLILPTYNEAANITGLLETVDGVLQSIAHEIIVVDDDSPDGTWKVAMDCAKRRPAVKVLRRVGKKGLSSAVMDGFDAAHGQILAVMDADGQHDAGLLLRLVSAIQKGADLSIGSRYVEGGSVGDWVADRRIISNAGTFFAKRLSQVPVSDPLGGFFAIKKELYKNIRPTLQPTGFKILLEILAAVPPSSRLVEVPLVFRMRLQGESKLSLKVHVQFLGQIIRLLSRRAFVASRIIFMAAFALALIAGAVTWIPHAWDLRLLYLDAGVRQSVQQTLKTVSDREGWLLSDVELASVSVDAITFLHREHSRVAFPEERCTVTFASQTLQCASVR